MYSYTPVKIPISSNQSDTLNLNGHALWQLMNCHTAPCRLMSKMLQIDLIHLGKILHIYQEHIDLDHFFDTRACFLEDGIDVGNAGGCFLRNAPFNQGSRCVRWDLARDIDLMDCFDGLGLI
jgi:hypothetical protein